MNGSDLFPGFASRHIAANGVMLFARIGGDGPPLALLHGFPQSHHMWRKIAPALAERFTVVVPDLRGYGASAAPASAKGELYTKRIMAEDVVALMRALGFRRFSLAGHDRGARVGYRLALDHPETLDMLAVLDVVPTAEMWRGMDADRAMQVYHWLLLAQPHPLPETLIAATAQTYLDHTLASWTASKSLDCFDAALPLYRSAFSEPERIHAMCEDYRAGATLDRLHDEMDFAQGRRLEPPLLALWGEAGIPAAGASPLDVWQAWAKDIRGQAILGGHFLPEEAPDATLMALLEFF